MTQALREAAEKYLLKVLSGDRAPSADVVQAAVTIMSRS